MTDQPRTEATEMRTFLRLSAGYARLDKKKINAEICAKLKTADIVGKLL